MHTILKYIYLKHTIVYSDNKINNCNNTIKGTGNILVFFSAIYIYIYIYNVNAFLSHQLFPICSLYCCCTSFMPLIKIVWNYLNVFFLFFFTSMTSVDNFRIIVYSIKLITVIIL